MKVYLEGVRVEDIIVYSGAERLRVYQALFELEQKECLEVMGRAGSARKGEMDNVLTNLKN